MTQPSGGRPPHEDPDGAGPGPAGGQPGAQQPQAAPGPYAPQPGPYGGPGPYASGAPQQDNPYAATGSPYAAPHNPYAQPQNPYAQPPGPQGAASAQPGPYGYPPQQYPGAPVPRPAASRGPFRGRSGVILASAVAALLVIGGGTWYALSADGGGTPVAKKTDDPKPSPSAPASASASPDEGDGSGGNGSTDEDLNAGRKPGESKVLWLQTNDVDLPHDGASVLGPWTVGDTVVKAMYTQVVGYSATTGRKLWALPTPAPVCAAPQAPTADGKIVVAYKSGTGSSAECNQLKQIDLATGKGGWTKEVPQFGTFDFLTDVNLTISGNTLTVGRTGHADAFRVSDGTTLFGKIAGDCQPYSFAGGPRLVAAESCPSSDSSVEKQQVQELDPATGKARWTFRLKPGFSVDKIYSVAPLVVSVRDNDKKLWSILSLTPDGRQRAALQGGKDDYQVLCGDDSSIFGMRLEGCEGVAADAATLYIGTKPTAAGTAGTNTVVAFDLATGKQRWRSAAPAGRTMVPIGTAKGGVVVYEPAIGGKGGVVATVASRGGTPESVQKHPDSTAEIESTFLSPRYTYADGRFYLTDYFVFGQNDAQELKTKTMMAFGD